MSIIDQIVDRCHISESNRQVINFVVSKLKQGRKTFFQMSKVERNMLMRRSIYRHKENKKLYYSVVNGV